MRSLIKSLGVGALSLLSYSASYAEDPYLEPFEKASKIEYVCDHNVTIHESGKRRSFRHYLGEQYNDYWQPPKFTESWETGDCEDSALYLKYLTYQENLPLRAVGGHLWSTKDPENQEYIGGHLWTERMLTSGEIEIMDPSSGMRCLKSRVQERHDLRYEEDPFFEKQIEEFERKYICSRYKTPSKGFMMKIQAKGGLTKGHLFLDDIPYTPPSNYIREGEWRVDTYPYGKKPRGHLIIEDSKPLRSINKNKPTFAPYKNKHKVPFIPLF